MGASWDLLESKKILEAGDGKATFMELFQDRVKTSKGQIVTYTRYNASDVVIVVPFLSDDRLVMIRQYRYPLDKVLLEFPAGHVEGGEDPGLTAKRESLKRKQDILQLPWIMFIVIILLSAGRTKMYTYSGHLALARARRGMTEERTLMSKCSRLTCYDRRLPRVKSKAPGP